MKYSYNDFFQISWDEYQCAAERVIKLVSEFCNKENIKIDFIVPILRGGAPLAISISHSMNIVPFYPCQYKYSYDVQGEAYVTKEFFSTIEKIEDKDAKYIILVTEGNHVSGGTAQKCINTIKSVLRNAIILYVSVGRDYAQKIPLTNTVFEAWGFLTNETESLSADECIELGVKEKFVVYPWENIEEELMEVNASLDCVED